MKTLADRVEEYIAKGYTRVDAIEEGKADIDYEFYCESENNNIDNDGVPVTPFELQRVPTDCVIAMDAGSYVMHVDSPLDVER